MMAELGMQLLDRLFQEDPGWKRCGVDMLAMSDHLVHRGFVIACHYQDNDLAATIVFRDMARSRSGTGSIASCRWLSDLNRGRSCLCLSEFAVATSASMKPKFRK